MDTGEYTGYRPDEIDAALQHMDKADVLIGHNILRHDQPLLKKLKSWQPRAGVLIRDTMVISRVVYPNLKATDAELIERGKMPPGNKYKGKHSIGAWGYRLGNPKGDYAALMEAKAREMGLEHPQDIANFVWGAFNEDMFTYMAQDCATNFDLWKHLKPDEYPQAPIELEHRVARVCDAMNIAGVPFNLKAAHELQANLVGQKHEIETKLKERYGWWWAPISPDPVKSVLIPKRDDKRRGYLAGYPIKKYKKVQFNPGSSDHLTKVLTEQGWKPTKFTPGGKPQMDEEVIESIGNQFPEMGELATLLMVNKRLSQLVGGASSKYPLIDCVQDDGKIHGVINPMGTITSRAAHMFPNLGQVPSAKKPYGKAFRALFHAPPGWSFLGADQQGLELRGLAHYLALLDGGKYAKTVIEGDPHWLHAVVMGLAEGERDKHNPLHTVVREDGSKRFIYAYVYGCGDQMAGSIIYEALLNARRTCGAEGEAIYVKFFGTDAVGEKQLRKVGKAVRNAFLTRIEGFGKLQQKLSEQIEKKGYVPGLDGRIIPIRSDHSALNFMIQSAGAVICKRWLVDAFEECERRYGYNWDDPWSGKFVFCLWVHDEVQLCVREGLEEEIGNIIVEAARKAGDDYGFRVPLDSEWVKGSTWEDTH